MDDVMPFSIKRKRDLLIKKKKRKTDDVMPLNRCSKRQKAARTCILSQRWRYLWKYTTCSIQFYNEGTLEFEAAEKFINSVNEGLKLHQGESIEQFKVGFVYPSISYRPNKDTEFAIERQSKVNHDIDGWINFAMEKQVKVFELNMAAGPLDSTGLWRNYSIPHVQKLLSISGEVKLLKTLTTLKSFRFVNIRITQEVVEFLLSHCPVLEQVCISASKSLKRLKVAGSLTKLRSMEISNCDSLKTMKVHAPGLVSFTYIGRDIKVPFKKVPLLSELTIGGDYAGSFIFDAHKHSSYCRNLKKLKLKVSRKVVADISPIGELPSEHPQLYNLKELELDITIEEDDGLCFFTFLTKCSPQLSRLTIKLLFLPGPERCIDEYTEWNLLIKEVTKQRLMFSELSGCDRPLGSISPLREVQPGVIEALRQYLTEARAADRNAQEATKFCHKRLEVVKLVGFIGCSSDCNLALHLLRIARSLTKMIIDTEGHPKCASLMNKKAIRVCVEQLKANLPPGAELSTHGPGFT
nr:PREDICTED: F-box/LRR-repeat protein At3g03360-like isoform X2 [Nicotiana tabacum]